MSSPGSDGVGLGWARHDVPSAGSHGGQGGAGGGGHVLRLLLALVGVLPCQLFESRERPAHTERSAALRRARCTHTSRRAGRGHGWTQTQTCKDTHRHTRRHTHNRHRQHTCVHTHRHSHRTNRCTDTHRTQNTHTHKTHAHRTHTTRTWLPGRRWRWLRRKASLWGCRTPDCHRHSAQTSEEQQSHQPTKTSLTHNTQTSKYN